MSDTVLLAIIAGVAAAVPAMLITILSHVRLKHEVIATKTDLKMEVVAVKADVRTVEVATNSMKDALIAAAFLAGVNQEKNNQRTMAAAAAAAVLAATVPPPPIK
jgi:hypothetical protein